MNSTKPSDDHRKASAFELRELLRRARVAKERLLWGGETRERVLLGLLEGHYESLFRRLWTLGSDEPHFTNHRIGTFRFGYARKADGPEYFYRGFFSSELLRPTDRVLDIGCGDGFFTRRFFSSRCASVDAIDIEPSAIEEATRHNAGENIRYAMLDAVNEPFPRPPYDVIVWDGALGHFAADSTVLMLKKIREAMAPGAVFTGSESLGHEGHDHLQFFDSLADMSALFKPFWKHVRLREVQYPISRGTFIRREGYWRCSDDTSRLEDAGWQTLST